MSLYQLPCPHCGTKLNVAKSQAGMTISCASCGGNVDVPTVRGFSELALAEPEAGGRARKAKGSATAIRILSVLLLMISIPCLAYGGYLYSIPASVSDRMDLTEEDLIKDIQKTMENLPPASSWDVWNEVALDGIAEMPIPQYFVFKRMVEAQRPTMLTCLWVGGGCFAAFIVTLFFSGKSK